MPEAQPAPESRLQRELRRLAGAGWRGRAQRLGWGLSFALTLPFAALAYLGLRLAATVRPVRIGSLRPKGRISIMISYLEPFLRGLELARGGRVWTIVINPGQDPNPQLSRMYRRAVTLLDDAHPWLRHLMLVTHRCFASRLPLHAPLRVGLTREFARAWKAGEPALRFTAEERASGERLLAGLGIPAGAAFMCFGLREAGYYQQFQTAAALARDPNPETGEDTYVRNPPLKAYLPMAAQCADAGLYALRMGQTVGERIPAGAHPRVLDYAAASRTDFGDIYLLAHCQFAVAGGAGLWWIAAAFNRPVVLTDHYAIATKPVRPGDLFIPKLVWWAAERRFLTFREMLEAGARYTYAGACREDGMELMHNTPDEITGVVREMRERVVGTWLDDAESEALQRRFNALYTPAHQGDGMPGRIGAEFLRQHADLLEG